MLLICCYPTHPCASAYALLSHPPVSVRNPTHLCAPASPRRRTAAGPAGATWGTGPGWVRQGRVETVRHLGGTTAFHVRAAATQGLQQGKLWRGTLPLWLPPRAPARRCSVSPYACPTTHEPGPRTSCAIAVSYRTPEAPRPQLAAPPAHHVPYHSPPAPCHYHRHATCF